MNWILIGLGVLAIALMGMAMEADEYSEICKAGESIRVDSQGIWKCVPAGPNSSEICLQNGNCIINNLNVTDIVYITAREYNVTDNVTINGYLKVGESAYINKTLSANQITADNVNTDHYNSLGAVSTLAYKPLVYEWLFYDKLRVDGTINSTGNIISQADIWATNNIYASDYYGNNMFLTNVLNFGATNIDENYIRSDLFDDDYDIINTDPMTGGVNINNMCNFNNNLGYVSCDDPIIDSSYIKTTDEFCIDSSCIDTWDDVNVSVDLTGVLRNGTDSDALLRNITANGNITITKQYAYIKYGLSNQLVSYLNYESQSPTIQINYRNKTFNFLTIGGTVQGVVFDGKKGYLRFNQQGSEAMEFNAVSGQPIYHATTGDISYYNNNVPFTNRRPRNINISSPIVFGENIAHAYIYFTQSKRWVLDANQDNYYLYNKSNAIVMNITQDGNLKIYGNINVTGCICYDNGATCLGTCI